jgi:hypothetical protein
MHTLSGKIAATALALLGLLSTFTVRADSSCTPRTYLSPEDFVTLERHSLELAPRITAKTAAPLKLVKTEALAQELGLSDAATTSRITERVLVSDIALEKGDLVRDSAQLAFDNAAGVIWIRNGDKTYELEVPGKPGEQGRSIDIAPKLLTPTRIILTPGTTVTLQGNNIMVAAGSLIAWDLYAPAAVPFRLQRSMPLKEVNVMKSAARVIDVSPSRTLPGGTVLVTLAVSDFDFKAYPPPLFCMSLLGPAGTTTGIASGVRGDLVSRSADKAVFSVQVPEHWTAQSPNGVGGNAAPAVNNVSNFFSGTPGVLRVLVDGDEGLAIDTTQPLTVTSRFSAVLIAFAATLATIWALASSLFKEGLAKTIRELSTNNCRYSLSNVQTFMWTVLVLFSMFYVWLANGQVILISSGILILLGISGGTLVASRTAETLDPTTRVRTGTPALSDLVSKNGSFDIPRFQMLAFTVFAWTYALVSVLRSEGLPDIPESLYLLMGISSATYVGSKLPAVVNNTAPDAPAPAPATVRYLKEATPDVGTIKRLQVALKVASTGVLDDATRQAIVAYKRANGIIPASPRLDQLLLKKILT